MVNTMRDCIQVFYVFHICLISSFITPPNHVLHSTVLSNGDSISSIHSSSNAEDTTTWHQPRFDKPFSSDWYYWQSNTTKGRDATNQNITTGTVKWIFNTTHMYYFFDIPSLQIEFHQFIINQTMYLWKEEQNENDNLTSIACYSYKLPFNIIENYFINSSFVGLTNAPNDNIHSGKIIIYKLIILAHIKYNTNIYI